MKKRILSLFLALVTVLTILPTAAFAAESTGLGISPVTDPNLWSTRLTSTGQPYSYRPPTAAGRQLYLREGARPSGGALCRIRLEGLQAGRRGRL